MIQDIAIIPVKDITPQVATSTVTGDTIDLAGYNSAECIIHIGVSGDTLSSTVKITPTIEESNSVDESGVLASGATATALVGTLSVVDGAADDDAVQYVKYVGSKRYIRVVLTFAGSHTNGCPVSAVIVRGNKRHSA